MLKSIIIMAVIFVTFLCGCASKKPDPVQDAPQYQEISPGQQSLITPPSYENKQNENNLEEKNI